MARVVDITDKLSFDENPTLVVKCGCSYLTEGYEPSWK